MGMGGRGTSTFQVDPTITVQSFLDMVIAKEGAVGIRIVTMGKQLAPTRNGKELTLADYGVYEGLNMHAALRLKGGAEGPSVSQHFDIKEVETIGATVVCNPQKPNGTKGDCIFGRSDGCYEDNVPKAKLDCGCILCADCMKWHVDQNIMSDTNPTVVLVCGDTSHNKQIDIALGYAVAGLTPDERNVRNAKLAEHQFKRPDSMIKYCPHGKCKEFVFRENSNITRVECGVCHQFMCWKCGQIYKGKQAGHCGNDLCDDAAYITLHLCEAKIKDIGGIKVTDTRICTNKQCCAINIHAQACKHMTCKKCAHQYCHICLQDWKGHQSPLCKVAPEQPITADMKYNK
eukprot:TRINITY_DN2436_c0_g1_i1.p1 TRINITY_DN2436_c0_g1~~TRINITY_DN2436_c0_g1_i1.p1  ORF type:complete len:345 (-),score=92.06 TRINITY_DN2436_c0_g1_i1:140-1174(-)